MKIEIIQNKIYEIRGEKVMLDFDIAHLYEVETRVFNQAVKRNIESFPKDFMLRLTAKEWKAMISQIVISSDLESEMNNNNSSQIVMSSRKHRGEKYLPYVFTEHGVTMVASVFKELQSKENEYCYCSGIYCFKKAGIFQFISNKFIKRTPEQN